jgi:hypothetical protein
VLSKVTEEVFETLDDEQENNDNPKIKKISMYSIFIVSPCE